MDEIEIIKTYKDRIRILLILYYFSETFFDQEKPHLKRIFTSEVRLQKLDFLLRYPNYFAFELLHLAESGTHNKEEIKKIVRKIFDDKEPLLKTLHMEKFFFGAYEDTDDVIGFLKSIGFLEFSSAKSLDLKITEKKYYLTSKAISNIESKLPDLEALNWYFERLILIRKYFGHLSGSKLKAMQYKVEEYESASWGDYINDIQLKVESAFFEIFGEKL